MMATDPVDVARLVGGAGGTQWIGMPAGTTMGHVHLHVGAIEPAKAFYSEAIGFDRTVWHYPGALFSVRADTTITSAPTRGPAPVQARLASVTHASWSGPSSCPRTRVWWQRLRVSLPPAFRSIGTVPIS